MGVSIGAAALSSSEALAWDVEDLWDVEEASVGSESDADSWDAGGCFKAVDAELPLRLFSGTVEASRTNKNQRAIRWSVRLCLVHCALKLDC